MNKLLFTATLVLAITLCITFIPSEAEAEIYTDTIRLHILARSDSDEDQATKLYVRDYLLREYGAALTKTDGAKNAKDELTLLLEEIEENINRVLASGGYDYGCTVTLGEEWYDTREYEDFTMPRGIYTSLIIRLGDGEGKNWWCVMYPPLCLDLATEKMPADDGIIDYTGEELALISGKGYAVKFKLLELVSDCVRELSKNG